MKKLLLLLSVIVGLSSCMTTGRVVRVTTIDLKKYADQGFWITEATSISYEYKPIGIVSVHLESGNVIKQAKPEDGDNIYGSTLPKKGKYEPASLEEAIDLLYHEAVEQGANTVINLKYQYVPATKLSGAAWKASGMAVKVD